MSVVILKSNRAVFGDSEFYRRDSFFVIVFIFGNQNRVFKSVPGIFKRVDLCVAAGYRPPPARKQGRYFRRTAGSRSIITLQPFSVRIVKRIGLSFLNSVRRRNGVKIEIFIRCGRIYARFQNTRFRRRNGRICPAQISVALTFDGRYDSVFSAVVFRHGGNLRRACLTRR